nr:type II secretion system protein [Phascolarctobacterium sp.]
MKKQTGFTLVELVIVIAVLGILAGMAIPHFMEAREEAAKRNVWPIGRRSCGCSMPSRQWVTARHWRIFWETL